MTLPEIDRLIRRLRAALKDPEAAAAAPDLAADAQQYADLCSAVNRRLEQCAFMLDEGEDLQAIQLAETEPPVRELLGLLSFDEIYEWQGFAQQNQLALPQRFDGRLVHRLQAIYEKGISLNHPLYRDYRTHIIKGRIDEAAASLRAIVKLNPSDASAKQELARLDDRLVARDLEELDRLTAAGDEAGAVAVVDRLERRSRTGTARPSGAAWDKASAARRGMLRRQAVTQARAGLAQLGPLHRAGRWQGAAPIVARLESLRTEHGFTFEGEEEPAYADHRAWAQQHEQEHAADAAYQSALDAARQAIDREPAANPQTGVSEEAAAAADLQTLNERWSALEKFGRPLPDGLEARYRARVDRARAAVGSRGRRRRNRRLAGVALAAIALGLGAYFFLQYQRTSEWVSQLDRLRAARQVGATEELLRSVRDREPSFLSGARAQAAAAAADAFVASERAREMQVETDLKSLQDLADEQPAAFASRRPEEVQALLTESQKLQSELAPEYQETTRAPLAALGERWDAWLAHDDAARNERFAADLARIEKSSADQLSYRRTPDELRQSVDQLGAALRPLAVAARQPPVPALTIRDDLAARAEAAQAMVASVGAELAKFDGALKAMHEANALEVYLDALRLGQDSELRGARPIAAAKQLLALHPSTDGLLASLLMPDDSDGWDFVRDNPNAGLVPDAPALPPERKIYDQLLVDPNIRNVYTYQTRVGAKTASVYSRGALEDDSGAIPAKPHGMLYLPDRSPSRLDFEDTTLDGPVTGAGVERDSQAFIDLKFRDLIDPQTGGFAAGQGAPLQEFLDRVVRQPKATALFKGYVFARMRELMLAGDRGGQWGLPFSPALVHDARVIEHLGVPVSGAWLVPDEIAHKGPNFEILFGDAAKVSYAIQARVLAAAVHEAARAGLTFRGFIDADGKPQFTGHEAESGAAQPDLWGWVARDGQPARLFIWSGKAGKYQPVAEPVPLTPLLAPDRDPKETMQAIVKRLGVSDSDYRGSVLPFLPPLFREPGAAAP